MSFAKLILNIPALALLAGGSVSFVLPAARSETASSSAGVTRGSVAPDISGIWQVTKYERSIRTIDGKRPPLKPEALKTFQSNLVAGKTLKPKEDMSRCVPPGTPRVMWAPFPMMILQTARKITFVHEYQHLLRHIYMDEPLPKADDLDPIFMGFSIGHWDNGTLIVETIGLNERTQLDREGVPHSEAMRLTERIRLVDNGKRLEDVMTIDDSESFTAPWSTRVVFERKSEAHLKEYNCVLKHEEF